MKLRWCARMAPAPKPSLESVRLCIARLQNAQSPRISCPSEEPPRRESAAKCGKPDSVSVVPAIGAIGALSAPRFAPPQVPVHALARLDSRTCASCAASCRPPVDDPPPQRRL